MSCSVWLKFWVRFDCSGVSSLVILVLVLNSVLVIGYDYSA